MSKYLKPTDLAREYGVVAQSIHRLIERGEIKGVRIGSQWRIDAESWDRYIGSQLNVHVPDVAPE